MRSIMRNLEAIEKDLSAAREALSFVEGTPAEVYSRIVGYYRSVRNWNKGKREEYGERRLYRVKNDVTCATAPSPTFSTFDARLLLFVRSTCPGCPPAKAAAGQLGIPVDLVNADTPEGIAEAVRRNVLSTPTAILLSPKGEELRRARDAETIKKLLDAEPVAMPIAV
jgi:ribonucleoside-triphosphate reductase